MEHGLEWTRTCRGISHCEKPGDPRFWATVECHGNFAILLLWSPGCGFKPQAREVESWAAGKEAAERWLTSIQ